jgi:hypothetical protein
MKISLKKLLLISLFFCMATPIFAEDSEECTEQSFSGRYSFTESGNIMGVGNDVEVGVYIADGNGNVKGTATMNVEGLGVLSAVFSNGSYSVNSNCTGNANFLSTLTVVDGTPSGIPEGTVISSSQRSIAFVMQRGKKIAFISTVPNNILQGNAQNNAGIK